MLRPNPSIGRSAAPYLLSLVLPLTTTAFLIAPVFQGGLAVVWFAGLLTIAVADELLPPLDPATRPPDARSYGSLVFLVAAIQLANFALFVIRAAEWGLRSPDTWLAVLLVGVGTAFSSIIAAHELIHKPPGPARRLGRLLLWCALYEQFLTEHLRGHHRTVGTADDVLTARSHETFLGYLVRSWPGELRSAWQLAAQHTARGSRTIRDNDVFHGLVAQAALLCVVGLVAGRPIAALVILQAAIAQFIVAAVNYFEHWEVVRRSGKVTAAHAWDCTAPLSHYALLGLSFHADHHVRASRSFDRLELHDVSPKLPHGYFTMIGLVLLRGAHARRLLAAELERSSTAADPPMAPGARLQVQD